MRPLLVVALLALGGCDQLLPGLLGGGGDLAASDGGGDLGGTMLGGKVCQLVDLRSPQSCQTIAPGRRVTIEENRAATVVQLDGSFNISLAGVGERATVAVVDASPGGTGVPTVVA